MYDCQIPGCNNRVPIRSTIKSGEHKGKKSCPGCKHKIEGVSKPKKPLKPFNSKTREKRKAERTGLPEFFERAIEELKKDPRCTNCGCAINVSYKPVRNVAHILPKAKYKSVMANPFNWITLCSSKDHDGKTGCHFRFDNRIIDIPEMPCFRLAKSRFEKFKGEVTERGKIFTIFEENNY
jgi:hypothetical protein